MFTKAAIILSYVLLQNQAPVTQSFQSFNFPQIFQPSPSSNFKSPKAQEKILLETISNTQNGKTATPTIQREVLTLVSNLEQSSPMPQLAAILENDPQLIDGTWFLQYTSPSEVQTEDGDGDGNDDSGASASWTVQDAEEKITTKKFNAKGTLAAGGLTVDVSNRVPKQIFNLDQSTLMNEVLLDNGTMVNVGGSFRLSEKKVNRAVAGFTECKITLLGDGITLDLGFLFQILAVVRGTNDSGWLETTYLSENVRIGRGNKGTMFVLTRDSDAVKP